MGRLFGPMSLQKGALRNHPLPSLIVANVTSNETGPGTLEAEVAQEEVYPHTTHPTAPGLHHHENPMYCSSALNVFL